MIWIGVFGQRPTKIAHTLRVLLLLPLSFSFFIPLPRPRRIRPSDRVYMITLINVT